MRLHALLRIDISLARYIIQSYVSFIPNDKNIVYNKMKYQFIALLYLTYNHALQTYNIDAQTGESSACATALLCGVKARYETLGLDAGGRFNNCASTINSKVSSLVDWAHDAGKSVLN